MRATMAVLFAIATILAACQSTTQPNQISTLHNGTLPALAQTKSRIFILGDTVSSGNLVSPMAMLNDRPLFRIDSQRIYVVDVDADKTILLRTELTSQHSPHVNRVRTYGFYNAAPKAGEELYFQLKFTGQSDVSVILVGEGDRVRSYNFNQIEAKEAHAIMPSLLLTYYSSL